MTPEERAAYEEKKLKMRKVGGPVYMHAVPWLCFEHTYRSKGLFMMEKRRVLLRYAWTSHSGGCCKTFGGKLHR